ncbi:hypothetical protein A2Z22_03320 [Candidatus Woesebacteria bacterium RBG_16_34_12]|uniref:phosphoribosylglycinamide formyltransferase 1 n=1 Tax=Candidatus Woesebacteria bacterium RBG_16_34_12 TaxID=1802480 RepID=A0A1F7XAN7_9BACT|nr:MAG: hypothetical protein A2Z22_03320 [Candidatus Woesebacteria bacterium RBG_16_34_12]
MSKESLLRTSLLISGDGTTAEAVIKACQSGKLIGIEPVAVISSRPDTVGIHKAQALGIETYVVQKSIFPTSEAFGDELLRILRNVGVDLVSQNGWLVKTPPNVIDEYRGKIINQHPGPLDPGRVDFGGKSMFGARVTCARVAYTWAVEDVNPWTESTTHHVTEEYDKGNLIRINELNISSFMRPVTIADMTRHPQPLIDATHEIQIQLLPLEHNNVIETLRQFSKEDDVPGFKRNRPLIPKNTDGIVNEAKHLASRLFPTG